MCCLWLEYLLKIGYHDSVLPYGLITERLRQFRGLISYDKMMPTGEVMTDFAQAQKINPMGSYIELEEKSNHAMIPSGGKETPGGEFNIYERPE